jgi:sulfite reductase (NADPH) flavoprotein alpha-component
VERALFIVSTYGEGDPPDAAAPFVRNTMLAAGGSLTGLHFGVLALGDSTYAQFCGFGRTLHQWLTEQGAKPLFERIDADRAAASAIEHWRQQLAHIAGTRDAPDWAAPTFERWTLSARERLNPGSDGEAACHLELRPADGAALPVWEAGDLLQVRVPGEEQPREYSIASIPADGCVQLLVRQARRADGTLGSASGWLLATAAVGATLDARLREHRGFRLGDNAARALILIGNGTGIAGLRALIKAREAQAAPGDDSRCWLIFGERSAQHDAFYSSDLERWQRNGVLTHCDLVYSRDQPQRRYVQHRLAECRDEVRAWIDAGAAIYVCGSLKGMAAEVDAVLEETFGREHLDRLTVAGRYRRDVY